MQKPKPKLAIPRSGQVPNCHTLHYNTIPRVPDGYFTLTRITSPATPDATFIKLTPDEAFYVRQCLTEFLHDTDQHKRVPLNLLEAIGVGTLALMFLGLFTLLFVGAFRWLLH